MEPLILLKILNGTIDSIKEPLFFMSWLKLLRFAIKSQCKLKRFYQDWM